MSRKNEQKRKTKETDIKISLELDKEGDSKIETPIPFFTHMLELFARHGNFLIDAKIKGDVEVDFHHTIEDTGIVLGKAFREALGEKIGINRYGFFLLPMDETLVQIVLDLSGRPYFKYDIGRVKGKIGAFEMEYCKHFFRSFAHELQMNLHIELKYGEDKHHIIEAIFKGVSKALSQAVKITGKRIPSTKELL